MVILLKSRNDTDLVFGRYAGINARSLYNIEEFFIGHLIEFFAGICIHVFLVTHFEIV